MFTGAGDSAQQQRELDQLELGLGQALKTAAASPAVDGTLWGILADYYTCDILGPGLRV